MFEAFMAGCIVFIAFLVNWLLKVVYRGCCRKGGRCYKFNCCCQDGPEEMILETMQDITKQYKEFTLDALNRQKQNRTVAVEMSESLTEI